MTFPSQIGDYQILGPLGSGAAGDAYHARHAGNDEVVAIKLLSRRMSADETVQRRFIREMAVMKKLEHENVVRYLDGGLHDDQFYYVMELLENATLKEVLAQRGLVTWQEAVECAIQVCAALECAHGHGVVHRDLKPANLFISKSGLIKLGDFGLARDLENDRLTMEGFTVGTCLYMAPEQSGGGVDIDGAADLYALGCLLHELLTGRPPFTGSTAIEVLDQHHTAPPPDPRASAPDCPARLAQLVQHLLAKNAADRPASAAAVQASLEAVLRGAASEETPLETVVETDVPTTRNLAERLTAGPEAPAREVSWKALAAIGLIVVLVVVLAQVL